MPEFAATLGVQGPSGPLAQPVRASMTVALPAYTASAFTMTATANGALPSIGGVTLNVGDDFLLPSQGGSLAQHNGLWRAVDLGSGSTPFRCVRTPGFVLRNGAAVVVGQGTNKTKIYVLTTPNPITIGTTSLLFEESTGGGGGGSDDQTADEVPFTANGDIAATDVQAAIQEVRDDTDTKLTGKLATSHAGTGGAAHANAVASGAAGFMTGADKAKLDGVAANALASVTTSGPVSGNGTSGSPVTIADGAITGAKLADDTITAQQIGPGAVTSSELATNSVTSAKIVDANVTLAKMATGSVDASKIVAATITDTQVAAANKDGTAGTPSMRTLGTGSTQALPGDHASITNDRVASGLRSATTIVSVSGATAPTSGQVLTATAGTTATWQTPTSGGAPTDAPYLTNGAVSGLSAEVNVQAIGADLGFIAGATGVVPLYVKRFSSGQTADLFQVRDHADSPLTVIDKDGTIVLNNIVSVSGKFTGGSIVPCIQVSGSNDVLVGTNAAPTTLRGSSCVQVLSGGPLYFYTSFGQSSFWNATSSQWGTGDATSSPSDWLHKGADATGTNKTGAKNTYRAPLGTGTGTPGRFSIEGGEKVASGTTAHTVVELCAFLDSDTDDETAFLIRVRRSGVETVDRVKIGAADSGGTGLRALCVAN